MESAVYLFMDTGKSSYCALAADAAGMPIHQIGVPNAEPTLSSWWTRLKNTRRPVVVDQPGAAAGYAKAWVLIHLTWLCLDSARRKATPRSCWWRR